MVTGPRVLPLRRDFDHGPGAHKEARRHWTSGISSWPSIQAIFRGAGDFQSDVATFLGALRATLPVDPAQPVMVAGDPHVEPRGTAPARFHPGRSGLMAQVRQTAQAAAARAAARPSRQPNGALLWQVGCGEAQSKP